jgi:release factor glutamine methyltransferase
MLRILGRAWRLLLHLRFRTLQRHRHDRLVIEQTGGKAILVLPQVMNPVLFASGEFLASVLSPRLVKPGATVLDMGTGSGICAIFAAQWAQRVVAVDLNPVAVRCARINALLHRLEQRVELREGDLFAPVQGERFDLILFNPPYLPGQPRTEFERALWSTGVIERFAAGLSDHLVEQGAALVLLSSIADETTYLKLFCARGYGVDEVARRHLIAEVLTVYRLAAK